MKNKCFLVSLFFTLTPQNSITNIFVLKYFCLCVLCIRLYSHTRCWQEQAVLSLQG